ncbi:MAG: Calx-beta domain-containing protein [Cyanobacteria bacterium P01_F01_bin.143]
MVIGADDRQIIPPNSSGEFDFPFSSVTAVDGQITITKPDNSIETKNVLGSGIVISPNHVLTAAHNVFDEDSQTQSGITRVTTSDNVRNLTTRNTVPINTANVTNINFLAGYDQFQFGNGNEAEEAKNADITLLTTSNILLSTTEVIGLIAFSDSSTAKNFTIRTAGYPTDFVGPPIPNYILAQELAVSPRENQSPGKIVGLESTRRFKVSTTVDGFKGQSGGGVWHIYEEGEKERVLGVYTEGSTSGSFLAREKGVLITTDIYTKIMDQIGGDTNDANADELPVNILIGTDSNLIGPEITGIPQSIGIDGNDTIVGSYRRERIIGQGGNDTLTGGGADDIIEGGKGDRDEAVFSDVFENYNIELIDDSDSDNLIFEFSHLGGDGEDGKDILESIEFAKFGDGGRTPLPFEDGPKNTASIEVPNPAPSINNPNDLHAANYLGFTSPISMLDRDIEPTVHYSLVPPGEPYNIAFIIDTSASMSVEELAEVKDAYINLTNYFIDNEIAENSNFAVINFSRNAVLQPNLTAEEAITAIQGLTPSTNPLEGTEYNDALFNAQLFFLQSPLDIGKENNIAFFSSDGKAHNNSGPLYHFDAIALRNIANVQAFGIDDGTNPAGAVTESQLNFVDSDNGLILSDASELTEAFGKSGLIDNIEEIEILKEGEVIQTILANELTDGPLGLSFESTIEELDVSLGAENTITVQASFIDETVSPGSDFIVASGLSPSSVDPLANIANGSSGNDELLLNPLDLGADGGEGDDKIIGNNYDNILNGDDGNDTILGHGGNDTINPGRGEDQVRGGDGIDTVVYEDKEFATSFFSQAGNILRVDGTDVLTNVEFIQFSDVRISAETLEVVPILEGSNVSVVEGNSGTTIAQFAVTLTTPTSADVIFDYNTADGNAIAGEDYLTTSGSITIAAGETSANISVEIIPEEVFESEEAFGLTLSNISGATFADHGAEYTLVANIENDDIEVLDPPSCNPTTGDDDLTDCATSGDDTIQGLEGNDSINGLAGNDSLNGQADNDSLNGGNGNDTLIGEQGNDILLGGNNDDSLNGGNGNDTLNGGVGNDTIYGNNDDDTLNGGDGNDTLGGGAGNDNIYGQNNDDRLVGGDGNDTLGGGSGNDSIYGQNDDDKLSGSFGNDILNGGTGNDSLFGNSDNDTLSGADGNDTLNGGSGSQGYLTLLWQHKVRI